MYQNYLLFFNDGFWLCLSHFLPLWRSGLQLGRDGAISLSCVPRSTALERQGVGGGGGSLGGCGGGEIFGGDSGRSGAALIDNRPHPPRYRSSTPRGVVVERFGSKQKSWGAGTGHAWYQLGREICSHVKADAVFILDQSKRSYKFVSQ